MTRRNDRYGCVVYGRYLLTQPDKAVHRSEAAVVYTCIDLQAAASKAATRPTPLCIKMMSDARAWRRELEQRAEYAKRRRIRGTAAVPSRFNNRFDAALKRVANTRQLKAKQQQNSKHRTTSTSSTASSPRVASGKHRKAAAAAEGSSSSPTIATNGMFAPPSPPSPSSPTFSLSSGAAGAVAGATATINGPGALAGALVVVPLHSAAAISDTSPYPGLSNIHDFISEMQQAFGEVALLPAAVVRSESQPKAVELMHAYPFAICLPMADRTLADVIAHEHTASTTMAMLKENACYMAQIVKSMHECGIVHAGISPTHIVRLSHDSNELAMLDFSTSVSTKPGPPRSPTSSARSNQRAAPGSPTSFAPARGARSNTTSSPPSRSASSLNSGSGGGSSSSSNSNIGGGGGSDTRVALVGAKTGYASPEFAAWAESQANTQGRSTTGAIELPRQVPGVRSLVDVDMWGLGMSLFELYAGRALLPHTRGVACLASHDRLQTWSGFDPDELDEIEHR